MAVYADIISIDAPGSAVVGERVDIKVKIKNKYSATIGIMVGGALDYGVTPWPQITFPSPQSNVPALSTYTFNGYFTMPNKNTIIHAYSYYYSAAEYGWIFDDEMTWLIVATAEPTPPPPPPEWYCATTRYLYVRKREIPTPQWLQVVPTRYLNVKKSEIPVPEWLQVAVADITVKKSEVPIPEWLQVATAQLEVLKPGVPEEEEKKFPVGAALLIGGGATFALLAATKGKKVTT